MAFDDMPRPTRITEAGLGLAQTEKVDKDQPIAVAWDRVQKQTDRIAVLTEKLFNRLRPILTPQDGAEPGNRPPQPACSPMAESMDQVSLNLGSSAEALERLMRRLEL